MRAFEAALSAPWAMLPERLEELLAIAAREHEPTPEVLEAYRSAQLARAERAARRNDTAILHVTGPLFRRANLFTEFSGATSYEVLRTDLQIALDDASIRSILINVDSPGGEVNGVDELAKAIFAAREHKRIVAYVGGMAASGGYWIASAASEIVLSDAALVGSIGVYMAVQDTTARDEAKGLRKIEFVSSQSPDKRPDLGTDAGRSRVQRMVDGLADVFIAAVAKHRGVAAEKVTAEFGKGGVEIGAQAIALGMADRIGTFESVLADLSSRGGASRISRSGGSMSKTEGAPAAETAGIPKAEHDAAVAQALADGKAQGVAEYKARRAAVLACEEAKGREALAETLIDTPLSLEQIKTTLAAAAVKGETPRAEQQDNPESYAARRVASAGLAAPGGKPMPSQAKLSAGDIYANRRKALKEV